MNENIKTVIYVGCACLLVAIAYASRPKDVSIRSIVDELPDKPLFPKFKDPGKATRMEIVKVTPDTGELQRFEVARDKKSGRWTIPSEGNYPADAEDRMRDASVMFVDLKPIAVQTMLKEEHAKFGVLEPSQDGETKDMGTLVNIEGRDNDELAQLIIGRQVKGPQAQRFVRVPGKDAVYVAEVDPEKLSTKFEDWIEKDLLKMNAWDIATVSLFDYTALETLPVGRFMLDERMQVDLGWDATKSQWNLQKMVMFRDRKPVPAQLGDDEQLNTEKLNALKSALDELEIIDVERKPEGMGADLRASAQFAEDAETLNSLFQKGFLPFGGPNDTIEIRSANGEVHVGMKDGVEYILRFGNPVQGTNEQLNRYLMVTAQFNEDLFAMPERPGGAADGQSNPLRNDGAAEENPTENPAENPEGSSGEETTPDDDEPAADDSPSPGGCQQEESSATDSSAAQAELERQLQALSNQDAASVSQADPEKEYQRQLDERNDKIKKGKARVHELNGRFADWYYVISEDVYKKIHLSRADIVKPKEGEEGTGIDSFRKLEEEGLKSTSPSTIPNFQIPGGE